MNNLENLELDRLLTCDIREEFTGSKTRSTMIAVGIIVTIVLTVLIAFTDVEIPLYALVLIVGCASVLTALIGKKDNQAGFHIVVVDRMPVDFHRVFDPR